MDLSIDLKDFQEGQKKISSWIKKTVFSKSDYLSSSLGSDIFLKRENEQLTGSFKVRGALNKILTLGAKKKVITASAGNHAQGVAYASKCIGTHCTVVLPENTPIIKELAVRALGAEIIIHGSIYDQSAKHALSLAKSQDKIFIPAYQDRDIIIGQGSIALEIHAIEPDLDSIIVPIGGGGLISGIACAIKKLIPKCRVYGVVSSVAPGMELLFHKKKYLSERDFTMEGLADGMRVKTPSSLLLKHFILPYVDDIVSVTDDEIAEAIVLLLEKEKTLVEGSGAAAVSALLKQRKIWDIGKKCGTLISGGNIDLNILSKVLHRGLKKNGRLGWLSISIVDKPGALHKITQLLGNKKANILSVHHERNTPDLSHGLAQVNILIETRGLEHLQEIQNLLEKENSIQKNFLR